MGKSVSGMGAVLIAATLWGFLGYFSRELEADGFSSIEVAFLRMTICTCTLLVLLLILDRKSLSIKLKDLWIFIVLGLFKLLVDLLMYESQIRINIGLSTVLQLTSPYFVLFFSVFLFAEKITPKKLLAIVIAFFGCILVTGLVNESIDFDTLGCLLALGSGICYASYIVGTKLFLKKGYSENTTLFYIFLFAMIVCAPFCDYGDMVSNFHNYGTLFNVLAMGLLMTLVPYYLLTFALKRIPAVYANVLGLFEVVVSLVSGYYFFDETFGIINMVGIALIPISVIILNYEYSDNQTEIAQYRFKNHNH